jgi:hypothetical protein
MPRLIATRSEIRQYLRLLEGTPERISACTAGATEAQLHTSPGNKRWSAAEILAHLRACEELWSGSIYEMLAQDKPVLPLVDERGWAKLKGYASLDFEESFQAFARGREELLRVLRELPEQDWSRTAIIEGRTHSVYSQTRRMALHEVEHCKQLEALLT